MKKIIPLALLLLTPLCGLSAVPMHEAMPDDVHRTAFQVANEKDLAGILHHARTLALETGTTTRKHWRFLDSITIGNGMVKITLAIPSAQGDIAARLYLSRECLLKPDRRLLALIPGSLANGGTYYEMSLPGREGFNAARILAKSGYCPVSIDLPGTGESFRPEAGESLYSDDAAVAVAAVARPIATALGVHKWDVYGETGLGNNAALVLARRNDVRSVIISTPSYRRFGPASGMLFDPGFRGFVASIPYWPMEAAFLTQFFGPTYPDVLDAAITAILGPAPNAIPTGVFNELATVPFTYVQATAEFVLEQPLQAAEGARADALLIEGSPNPAGSEAGTAEQVAAYGAVGGGQAQLVVLDGASHLMRFDETLGNGPTSAFWQAALDFLAAH